MLLSLFDVCCVCVNICNTHYVPLCSQELENLKCELERMDKLVIEKDAELATVSKKVWQDHEPLLRFLMIVFTIFRLFVKIIVTTCLSSTLLCPLSCTCHVV